MYPLNIGKEGNETLDIQKLCKELNFPVIAEIALLIVAKLLMNSGVAGLMVGIGPGGCTSRGVLGIGIPQATAISDCSSADDFFKESEIYTYYWGWWHSDRGDICKCLACGADAVMIGSPIARSSSAPGRVPLGHGNSKSCLEVQELK